MPSFASITSRLGDALAAYQIGSAEKEARDRVERLQALDVGLRAGTAGLDISQLAPDLVSQGNQAFTQGITAANAAGLKSFNRAQTMQDKEFGLKEKGVDLQARTLDETIRGNQVREDQGYKSLDLQRYGIQSQNANAAAQRDLTERLGAGQQALTAEQLGIMRETAQGNREYQQTTAQRLNDALQWQKEQFATKSELSQVLHPKDYKILDELILQNYSHSFGNPDDWKSDGKGGQIPPADVRQMAARVNMAARSAMAQNGGKTVGDWWTAVDNIIGNQVMRHDGTFRPKYADSPAIEQALQQLDTFLKKYPDSPIGSRGYAVKVDQLISTLRSNPNIARQYNEDYLRKVIR